MLSRTVPNFFVFSLIATASLSAIFSTPANAGSRYGAPPPAVLSQDLTAPWVLQLRIPPPRSSLSGTSNRYEVQVSPKPVYQRPAYRANVKKQRHTPSQATLRRTISPVNQAPTPVVTASKKKSIKRQIDPRFEPQLVPYDTARPAGTIVIDTNDKFLYLVMNNGQARRYGVGVGKPGFEWAGTHNITRKAEWPDWRPPAQMIAREKKRGRDLPRLVTGGPQNPLGARALYLGSTLYRIHGTNSPWTIGKAVSSGCIRMRNEDVMDLYERVRIGTKVVVS